MWTFKLSQLLLSLGTVVLVFLIAKRILKRESSAALIAGIAAMFNAQNIWFAGYALAEPIYGFLMLLSFYFLLRAYKDQWLANVRAAEKSFFSIQVLWLLLSGVAFMFAFYMKGIAPFIVIFFSLWVLAQKWNLKNKFLWLSSFATGCLIVIAIHASIAYSYYGKPVISSSAGCLNFVEGKCPW